MILLTDRDTCLFCLTSFQNVCLGYSYYYVASDHTLHVPILSGFELSALGPLIYSISISYINYGSKYTLALFAKKKKKKSLFPDKPCASHLIHLGKYTYVKLLHKNFTLKFQIFSDSANQNPVLSFSIIYLGNHIALNNHVIIGII